MSDGRLLGGAGWTAGALGARDDPGVDGLITGWHAPGASHLDLLEAVVGPDRCAARTRPPSTPATCGTNSATVHC